LSQLSIFGGKSCVVTGGASGIGFALAEALLNHGAQVLIAGPEETALLEACNRLTGNGHDITWQLTDVGDASDVARLIDVATGRFGSINYLFNNAGVGGTLPISKATLEQWRHLLDVNLWGVIHGTHYALPVMRRQGSGHIVNTASAAGLVPLPGQALYNTSKYGVVGFSESLRLELADDGIKLTVVCPGPVASEMWGKSITGNPSDRRAPAGAISPKQAAKLILAGVAQERGILVFPAKQRWGWRMYRWFPKLTEFALRLAAHRSGAIGEKSVASARNVPVKKADGNAHRFEQHSQGSASTNAIAIARAAYEAYVSKDRAAIEALIADDFHFTSPIDNRLDRATYFTRCWPNSATSEGFEFIYLVPHGEQVFVTYEARGAGGHRFRNTEIVTVRGAQIVEVQVYFGWDLPHKAALHQ
jgi:NAD(P)-dependent dehydrogenase (short-subunit alcohol dehydrogenase family)